MSDLNFAESKDVLKLHRRSAPERKLCTAVCDGVQIKQILLFDMAGAGRNSTMQTLWLLSSSAASTEIKKGR